MLEIFITCNYSKKAKVTRFFVIADRNWAT